MRSPLPKPKGLRKALALILALMALGAPTGASAAITGWTETRQTAWFTGTTPNTQYSVYFYASHYPADQLPYIFSYAGFESNAYGQFKASLPVDYFSKHYEGGEGPVYSVKACLLEPPLYQSVACTPYSYVGYLPSQFWTYAG